MTGSACSHLTGCYGFVGSTDSVGTGPESAILQGLYYGYIEASGATKGDSFT